MKFLKQSKLLGIDGCAPAVGTDHAYIRTNNDADVADPLVPMGIANSKTSIPQPLSLYLHLELFANDRLAFLELKENVPPLWRLGLRF